MNGPIRVIPGSNLLIYLEYTKWDKLHFKGPITLGQFVNHIESSYNISVSMVTYGSATIYPAYNQNPKKRLQMTIPNAIQTVLRKPVCNGKKFLQLGVTGTDEKEIDCMLPDIKYEI